LEQHSPRHKTGETDLTRTVAPSTPFHPFNTFHLHIYHHYRYRTYYRLVSALISQQIQGKIFRTCMALLGKFPPGSSFLSVLCRANTRYATHRAASISARPGFLWFRAASDNCSMSLRVVSGEPLSLEMRLISITCPLCLPLIRRKNSSLTLHLLACVTTSSATSALETPPPCPLPVDLVRIPPPQALPTAGGALCALEGSKSGAGLVSLDTEGLQ
jgi:hypothetical protein